MFFIQVVHDRPGGRLQFSGGGSKMAWLASAFSSIHSDNYIYLLTCFDAVGWVAGCWHGYLISDWNDLHTAQLMPMPLIVSCFSKIRTGFTFLVPAHPGSPEKGPLNVCAVFVYCLQ